MKSSSLVAFLTFLAMGAVSVVKSADHDFSSLAALRETEDAHFVFEYNRVFSDTGLTDFYYSDVYIRKSSHGNHLIFIDEILTETKVAEDDLDSLKLPFIAVVRNGFLRSIYAWPNDTRTSLSVKGELAQILARDFSTGLNRYILTDTLGSFEFTTNIEDTPVGRGCYDTPLTISLSEGFYNVEGRVERGKCEEVFSYSSYFESKPTSSFEFKYRYDADTKEFREAETKLLLERVNEAGTITLTNRLKFVGYVEQTKVIDDTKLKKRWAGYAELLGYLYA